MACSRLKGPLPDAQLLLVCHHHPEDLGQRQLPGSAAARTESAGAADLDAPFPSATNRASARRSVRPTQATSFKPAQKSLYSAHQNYEQCAATRCAELRRASAPAWSGSRTFACPRCSLRTSGRRPRQPSQETRRRCTLHIRR